MPPDTIPTDSNTPQIEPDKNIHKSIMDVLLSPEFREFVNKGREIRRPKHTSKMSNFSYYREQFGLEMKLTLDDMVIDKHDRLFRYSAYPELRPSSLYQRINQSLNFLLRELDADGRYQTIRDMLIVDKSSNKAGIMLMFLRDKLQGRVFKPDIITDQQKTFEWKEQVEEFLQDEQVKVLHLKNLALTTSEQETITNSLVGLTNIDCIVTEREIKIIKSESPV